MKNAFPVVTSLLLLGLLLVLINCGGTSSGGGYANVNVQYTVSGSSISNNANDSKDFTDPLTGTDYKTLIWYCGNYQGGQKQRVELTFKKVNNTWVLDSTIISGGNCT
jgi:hypothetical protein